MKCVLFIKTKWKLQKYLVTFIALKLYVNFL